MRTFVHGSNFFSCYAPRLDLSPGLGTGKVSGAQSEILKLVGEQMRLSLCAKSRRGIAGTEVMRDSASHGR